MRLEMGGGGYREWLWNLGVSHFSLTLRFEGFSSVSESLALLSEWLVVPKPPRHKPDLASNPMFSWLAIAQFQWKPFEVRKEGFNSRERFQIRIAQINTFFLKVLCHIFCLTYSGIFRQYRPKLTDKKEND